MTAARPQFTSKLAWILDQYIDKCIAEHAEMTLARDFQVTKCFDRFLDSVDYSGGDISEETICDWIAQLSYLSAGTLHGYECIIQKALRFAKSFGIRSTMPPIVKVADTYQPYIFSQAELERLCSLADNLRPHELSDYPWIHVETPMVLRILIGCGTRITETLLLQMKDVDLTTGILTMKHSKGGRERLVPVHEGLKEILIRYCMAMGIVGNPDAWLFPAKNTEEPLNGSYFAHRFSNLLAAASIKPEHSPRCRGASVHCIRHTFACNSLQSLQKQGIHMDNRFPYLSVYMGHKGLYDTQKYLKLTAEMVSDETDAFETSIKSIFDCPVFLNTEEWV